MIKILKFELFCHYSFAYETYNSKGIIHGPNQVFPHSYENNKDKNHVRDIQWLTRLLYELLDILLRLE